MKAQIKVGLFTLLVFGTCTTTWAQLKYITHSIKEGETVYSIAQYYKVSTNTIFQENPEIKQTEKLKPNTILIIRVSDKQQQQLGLNHPNSENEITKQIDPIRFKNHHVKKKETLFKLTQQYGVTEEQIKRHNKRLYAEPLKKGMVIQIPEYPKATQVIEEERELDFETYMVQPKETRWSIAHKYGISVDSLVVLNPTLPKNTSYLAIGEALRLPRLKGDSIDDQQVTLFESYTVPKAMGLFRVSQNYKIPVDSILQLNPEIKEIGGLKEGMVLRLPKAKTKIELINTDNFVFYEVKPKQTVFRLTQQLKISRDSLFLLNPELENGLKSGMILKLPKTKMAVLEVKDALVLDQFDLIDSLKTEHTLRVMTLLPFRLNNFDFLDEEGSEKLLKRIRDTQGATGFYTGMLVALDSAKALGLKVNLKVLDTQRKLSKVKELLAFEDLKQYDAIIGPIDTNLLPEVSLFANRYQVPVIAPFTTSASQELPNVFFANPDEAVLREHMLNYIEQVKENQNLIVIADKKHQRVKDSILARFPLAYVAKMRDDESLDLIDFKGVLSEEEENWVFVETDQPNLVASFTSILNSSNRKIIDEETEEETEIVVKMFTTHYNKAFEAESVSKTHLSKLDFTFSSNYHTIENNKFAKAYAKKFGHQPDRYAVKGFDLMMDVLLRLGYDKNLFESAQRIGATEYVGNRFNYFNTWFSGYTNKATYLLCYDHLRIKQLSIK